MKLVSLNGWLPVGAIAALLMSGSGCATDRGPEVPAKSGQGIHAAVPMAEPGTAADAGVDTSKGEAAAGMVQGVEPVEETGEEREFLPPMDRKEPSVPPVATTETGVLPASDPDAMAPDPVSTAKQAAAAAMEAAKQAESGGAMLSSANDSTRDAIERAKKAAAEAMKRAEQAGASEVRSSSVPTVLEPIPEAVEAVAGRRNDGAAVDPATEGEIGVSMEKRSDRAREMAEEVGKTSDNVVEAADEAMSQAADASTEAASEQAVIAEDAAAAEKSAIQSRTTDAVPAARAPAMAPPRAIRSQVHQTQGSAEARSESLEASEGEAKSPPLE
jgi:hypothetical protein